MDRKRREARLTPRPAGRPRSYLQPGTPEVGGVRHLMLIYCDAQQMAFGSPAAWDARTLLPYVTYVDRQGKAAGLVLRQLPLDRVHYQGRRQFVEAGGGSARHPQGRLAVAVGRAV